MTRAVAAEPELLLEKGGPGAKYGNGSVAKVGAVAVDGGAGRARRCVRFVAPPALPLQSSRGALFKRERIFVSREGSKYCGLHIGTADGAAV